MRKWRDGRFESRSGWRRTGEIHFLDGHICHAIASDLSGWTRARDDAVEKRRVERKRESHNAPCTIHGPWQHVFREALRKTKPRAKENCQLLRRRYFLQKQNRRGPSPDRKKNRCIDDTEMLSIFVEDGLSIADPSLQILTAFTGAEGVKQVETIMPDLVLLDYSLPDLRGDQVCERLLRTKLPRESRGHDVRPCAGNDGDGGTLPERRCDNCQAFYVGSAGELVKKTLAKGRLPSVPKEKPAPALTAGRSSDNGRRPGAETSIGTATERSRSGKVPQRGTDQETPQRRLTRTGSVHSSATAPAVPKSSRLSNQSPCRTASTASESSAGYPPR